MLAPFDSARVKIERAKRHLQELEREIGAFFARGGVYVAFESATEYTEATGFATSAFTYRESEPIPISWAAIVGDILHNLRSSLDLIASDVHRLTGGDPKDTSYVHYPFCKDASGLNDMIKSRRLSRAGREYLDLIKETAPFRDGNVGLRAIHDLDMLDKHQALVPTVAVVTMDWPVEIKQGPQQFSTGATQNGQRLIIFPSSFANALPQGTRIKADFSIVFGDVGPFRGNDVTKQLQACIVGVEGILTRFRDIADAKAKSDVPGS